MTQPVYDLELVERTLEHVKEFNANVLLGILPLQSYRHAEFLHNEVPGISIPEFVLAQDARGRRQRPPGGRRDGPGDTAARLHAATPGST